jgi:hypothetical protein
MTPLNTAFTGTDSPYNVGNLNSDPADSFLGTPYVSNGQISVSVVAGEPEDLSGFNGDGLVLVPLVPDELQFTLASPATEFGFSYTSTFGTLDVAGVSLSNGDTYGSTISLPVDDPSLDGFFGISDTDPFTTVQTPFLSQLGRIVLRP